MDYRELEKEHEYILRKLQRVVSHSHSAGDDIQIKAMERRMVELENKLSGFKMRKR